MPAVDATSAVRSGVYREHVLSVPDPKAPEAWSILPDRWVQAFAHERFDRAAAGMVLDADTYFGVELPRGKMLPDLYPTGGRGS
jgi:hypothetical protein